MRINSKNFSEEDRFYMGMAIDLAKKGIGWVSPNPLVGAVIVKEGRIIGKGYHPRHGDLHAERAALKSCGEDPRGATMYVSLEPCCHQGKQPPCTEAIIAAGIKEVYVASRDPNEKVGGRGILQLEEAGVRVYTGLLEEEALALNPIFFHYIQTKRPYVALKHAMTLDGKIASRMGDSRGISGKEANEFVHFLRFQYRAILVGIGTVLADNPRLTCRREGGRDPIRVIADLNFQLPIDSILVNTAKEVATIAAVREEKTTGEKALAMKEKGVEILGVRTKGDQLDLKDLLQKLGEREIDSILVEGGGTINQSFMEEGLVQKLYTLIAPKWLGGRDAISPGEGNGIEKIKDAIPLNVERVSFLGEDILIESRLKDVYGNC